MIFGLSSCNGFPLVGEGLGPGAIKLFGGDGIGGGACAKEEGAAKIMKAENRRDLKGCLVVFTRISSFISSLGDRRHANRRMRSAALSLSEIKTY